MPRYDRLGSANKSISQYLAREISPYVDLTYLLDGLHGWAFTGIKILRE